MPAPRKGRVRDAMITIALYRGRESGHFWSWLLAWLDRTVYSHAAIVWGIDGGTAF